MRRYCTKCKNDVETTTMRVNHYDKIDDKKGLWDYHYCEQCNLLLTSNKVVDVRDDSEEKAMDLEGMKGRSVHVGSFRKMVCGLDVKIEVYWDNIVTGDFVVETNIEETKAIKSYVKELTTVGDKLTKKYSDLFTKWANQKILTIKELRDVKLVMVRKIDS